jgi:hypothetical protein
MRFTNKLQSLLITTTLVFLLGIPSAQAQVSNAELLEKLESMQMQIDALKRQIAENEEEDQ